MTRMTKSGVVILSGASVETKYTKNDFTKREESSGFTHVGK